MLPNSYMCIYGWLPAECCQLKIYKANISKIKPNATQKEKTKNKAFALDGDACVYLKV